MVNGINQCDSGAKLWDGRHAHGGAFLVPIKNVPFGTVVGLVLRT